MARFCTTDDAHFCLVNVEARWRSGDAEDCKSSHAGSIPARASRHVLFKFADRAVTLKTPDFWQFSAQDLQL
jgi:hypothetical protein